MKKRKSSKQSLSKICEFPPDSHSEELKALVNDPRYVCTACGRTARADESLCKPERMYSSW